MSVTTLFGKLHHRLNDFNDLTRGGIRKTSNMGYHEAVPGHHIQLAIQQELTELPRSSATSRPSSKGGGCMQSDWPTKRDGISAIRQGRLGYLNNMLWRARRLVVDTGIHAKHWTLQQGIDYGIAPYELERYVVYPGQACAYMIGHLKIVELREKVRAKLGDKSSIKAFHNAVLKGGSVPLSALEARWSTLFPNESLRSLAPHF